MEYNFPIKFCPMCGRKFIEKEVQKMEEKENYYLLWIAILFVMIFLLDIYINNIKKKVIDISIKYNTEIMEKETEIEKKDKRIEELEDELRIESRKETYFVENKKTF